MTGLIVGILLIAIGSAVIFGMIHTIERNNFLETTFIRESRKELD